MREAFSAILIFFCLAGSAIGCLLSYERRPAGQRRDDTRSVVRVATNLFVVMASLVLGLMVVSTRNEFAAVDQHVHAFATEMVLLDRTLRAMGPAGAEPRARLLAYAQRARSTTWPEDGAPLLNDRDAETLLNAVQTSLDAVTPSGPVDQTLWREARERLQHIVELRSTLVDESDGAIPSPLIVMLVAWLMLIFASFGYRAPRNQTVVMTLVVSAALIAAALYLILDMDIPFSGPIRVSPASMQHAIEQMQL